MKAKKHVRSLERQLKRMRRHIRKLAKALYKHARTDMAPDAALPELKKLRKELSRS